MKQAFAGQDFPGYRLSELEQAFQQLKEFEQLLLSMHYQDGMPIRSDVPIAEPGEAL